MSRVFIGVGSNIHPAENVRKALKRLAAEVRIEAISTFYRTVPEGRSEQPPFYNGVVEVETDLPPVELKKSVLHRIEDDLGRLRTEDKCAPRTIDLDVILYDDLCLTDHGIVIPDPQIADRAFLAVPLHELAPELVLPDSGRPVKAVAEAMRDHRMEPLPEFTRELKEELSHGL